MQMHTINDVRISDFEAEYWLVGKYVQLICFCINKTKLTYSINYFEKKKLLRGDSKVRKQQPRSHALPYLVGKTLAIAGHLAPDSGC